MDWTIRMNRALDYIESNLDEEIDFNYAAKLAFCSLSSLTNMFKIITGIPLNEYIRRRRLSLAALELQSTNEKIIDISLKYGYSSPTAFNRAFQKQHKVSPQYARSRGISITTYPRIAFQIKVKGDVEMKCKIETKPAFSVVGIKKKFRNDMEGDHHIPNFWRETPQETYDKILSLADSEPKGLLGLCANFDGHEFDYFIAASTTNDPLQDLEKLEIPAATWVIFEQEGTIPALINRFWNEWLPSSGYRRAKVEFPDIEVYKKEIWDKDNFNSTYELWFPVEKE
ncbi:AraC family transcriptional regulator [Vallitalea okinawensis]|uniref:AraC family transcriptional regulator n=1 Tax=Vallitalea okinawensis TaxID=2078660 RepID=UPI000CFB1B33|nr:AraC family transcriptional regulator [Vallitalea okinawensis]